MNLCSDGHDEVCHEGRICPACSMKEERDSAMDELKSSEKRISELEDQLSAAE